MGMKYGLTNSKLLWTHFMRQDEDVLKCKHFYTPSNVAHIFW